MSASRKVKRMIDGQKFTTTDQLLGLYKGIVEEVRDPMGLGRIKARIFSLHGSIDSIKTESLPWAEACFPFLLSYCTPKIGDRVWIGFEAADRHRPIWIGFWNAIPVGRKGGIHNKRIGSEIPRECWTNGGLESQAVSIYRSHEGNQLFVEDIVMGKNYYGAINLQDSGGKTFKLQTIKDNPYPDSDDNIVRDKKFRNKDLSNTNEIDPKGTLQIDTGNFCISSKTTKKGTSVDMISSSNENNSCYSVSMNGKFKKEIVANGPQVLSKVSASKEGSYSAAKFSKRNSIILDLPEVW